MTCRSSCRGSARRCARSTGWRSSTTGCSRRRRSGGRAARRRAGWTTRVTSSSRRRGAAAPSDVRLDSAATCARASSPSSGSSTGQAAGRTRRRARAALGDCVYDDRRAAGQGCVRHAFLDLLRVARHRLRRPPRRALLRALGGPATTARSRAQRELARLAGFSPFQDAVFSLEHEIEYMVILPGGRGDAGRPRRAGRRSRSTSTSASGCRSLAQNSEDWLAGAKLPKGASLRMWTFQMLYEALLEMTMETEVSWGGSFAYRDAPPFADEPPASRPPTPSPTRSPTPTPSRPTPTPTSRRRAPGARGRERAAPPRTCSLARAS